jgi:glycosyltransferase involved in cell wall biosynthesis
MRVAFIGQKGIPAKNGGVERHLENLAINLAKMGHEVFVYARSSYNTERLKKYQGVKIITVPTIASKNLDAIMATFLAVLDTPRRHFDIIHFQSIGPASLLRLARVLNPKKPLVFTFHCQDYYQKKWGPFGKYYLGLGERIGNRHADRTIAISKELAEYADQNYHNHAIYIPSGIKINEITEAAEIKKLWGLEKNSYILAVSRLVRHKGLHYLIKAYQGIKTDRKLVITGTGSFTDDYIKELHDLAAANPNIIFTGNQTSSILQELYSNAAIFIQPSEYEGLSLSLLEAMSYRRPCLVSDISSNCEALDEAGIYFKNKNVDDLRIKLSQLLNQPEKWVDYGDKAWARIKAEYTENSVTAKTEAVYQKLLNK